MTAKAAAGRVIASWLTEMPGSDVMTVTGQRA